MWISTECASGGSDSPVMGIALRMPIRQRQVICGPLPDRAVAVATVPGNDRIDVRLGAGVFLIDAPVAQGVTVSFRDAAGLVVGEHEIPVWSPPPRGLLSRLWLWAMDRGIMPAPRGTFTYGAGIGTKEIWRQILRRR